jgi:short-subunit dehydrogenase
VADELRDRGCARLATEVRDARDVEAFEALLGNAEAALGGLDALLVAHGTLPDPEACRRSVGAAVEAFHTNATSVIALVTAAAERFERRGGGAIVVLSSVAGERGRGSNYLYGAAKAAVSTFLEGLGERLHGTGVRVVAVKPGRVDTPMTASFRKGPLWATPEGVAPGIVEAIDRGDGDVYLPGWWRWPMLAVRLLPRGLHRRLRL